MSASVVPGVGGLCPHRVCGQDESRPSQFLNVISCTLAARQKARIIFLGTSLGDPAGARGLDASERGAGYLMDCAKGGDHDVMSVSRESQAGSGARWAGLPFCSRGLPVSCPYGGSFAGFRLVSVLDGQERSLGVTGTRGPAHKVRESLVINRGGAACLPISRRLPVGFSCGPTILKVSISQPGVACIPLSQCSTMHVLPTLV